MVLCLAACPVLSQVYGFSVNRRCPSLPLKRGCWVPGIPAALRRPGLPCGGRRCVGARPFLRLSVKLKRPLWCGPPDPGPLSMPHSYVNARRPRSGTAFLPSGCFCRVNSIGDSGGEAARARGEAHADRRLAGSQAWSNNNLATHLPSQTGVQPDSELCTVPARLTGTQLLFKFHATLVCNYSLFVCS